MPSSDKGNPPWPGPAAGDWSEGRLGALGGREDGRQRHGRPVAENAAKWAFYGE